MDHSQHGGMDHGHDGMDMGPKCSMNMLFTWSTKDLCIIFPEWHVTGTSSLLASLLAIVLLTAVYEGVRDFTRRYEVSHMQRLKAYTSPVPVDDESADVSPAAPERSRIANLTSSLLVGRDSKVALERRGKVVKALLYAIQVFYSFFIMLLFMTYNGWVMLAVAVGAFVGYLAFGGNSSASKTVACH